MTKAALLIGVSEYQTEFSSLPKAKQDVEAMHRVLQNHGTEGFDQIQVLFDPDVQTMRIEIETLFAGRSKEDVLLLFFSGHGLKDDQGKLYFAAQDTRKSLTGELVRATAVAASFVQELMDQSRCKRQVVILDCCFSGAFAAGMQAKDSGTIDIEVQLGGEGRAVLTSSNSTQYSFEEESSDLSIYTRYLVEGLETGVADLNHDGWIDVEELHDYVKKKVQETAPAMKPEIYAVKEGFKIHLMHARIGDPKLRYRQEAERYVSLGEIRGVERMILNTLRDQLGVSVEDAAQIEDELLRPYQERLENLRQYREALLTASQSDDPFSERVQTDLKHFQAILGLRDEDVIPIQAEVMAEDTKTAAKYRRKQEQEAEQEQQLQPAAGAPQELLNPPEYELSKLPTVSTPRIFPMSIWQKRGKDFVRDTLAIIKKRKFCKAVLAALTVFTCVIGGREVGFLQTWELEAFDQLMGLRPPERPDPRLLLITVTAEDVNAQAEKGQGSLSNQALSNLLEKLNQYNPAVIGVDIYRQFPVEPEYATLKERLLQDDQLVTICSTGAENDPNNPGYPPPPEIRPELVGSRVGFSDIPIDDSGEVVRRHLLGQSHNETCPSNTSFSLMLVQQYLQSLHPDLEVQQISLNNSQRPLLKIGDVDFRRLDRNAGGYQQEDNEKGYQILLNYRATAQANRYEIAEQITLGEAMNGGLSPERVNDRIILIGTTDKRYKDLHRMPYTRNPDVPGVIIQAHMVSQILSAVLDGRPLLWWWSGTVEMMWIGVWAVLGGMIAWRSLSLLLTFLLAGGAIVILWGCCYIILLQGGWVPLVPSALAFIGTQGAVVICWRFSKV